MSEPRWKRDQDKRRAQRQAQAEVLAEPKEPAPVTAPKLTPAKPPFDKVGFAVTVTIVVAVIALLIIWNPLGGGDSNDDPSSAASGPAASSYFPASCNEWLASDDASSLHTSQASEFLADNLPGATNQDAAAFAKLITVGCQSYGNKETPQHIAKVTLQTYEAGN